MTKKTKTLIKGASIVSMDSEIGDIPKGDILIVDDIIADIGPDLDISDADVEIIDATGMIASPGFIDTHRHVWQTQLKGVAGDWSLFDYTCLMRTMYCICYGPEDALIANFVGASEAINAGITSMVDHSHLQMSEDHSDALVQGIKNSGIRGIFCYGVYRNPKYRPGDEVKPSEIIREISGPLEDWHRKNALRVRETHFPSNDGLLKFGIASSEFCVFSETQPIIDELKWSRNLDPARISIHIGMGINEELRIIPLLANADLLGDDLLFVHGAHLTDSDLALLNRYGGGTSTTPETELQMGMGYPVLERVVESGSMPSLGIDIVSNFAGDMFAQMRLMLQTMRFRNFESEGAGIPTTSRYAARNMLEFATLGGAKVMGIDKEVGSLTKGKKADIILTRTNSINMSPVADPVAALVFYANVNDIDSVWINGVARKRNGVLTYLDWKATEQKLQQSRDHIFEQYSKIPEKKLRNAWAPLWGLEANY